MLDLGQKTIKVPVSRDKKCSVHRVASKNPALNRGLPIFSIFFPLIVWGFIFFQIPQNQVLEDNKVSRSQALNSENQVISISESIGLNLLKKGDLNGSISLFKKAIQEYQDGNNQTGYLRANLYLVNSYIGLKEYDNADLNLDLVQYYLKENYSPALLDLYYTQSIRLEVAKGNLKSALKLSQKYNRLKDSLNAIQIQTLSQPGGRGMNWALGQKAAQDNTNQALMLRERYTVLIGVLLVTLLLVGLVFLYSLYRAKRNAFEITEQANILIHQKNEELERLNQLKNKLFSIIAHDVRSPLNNLAGVLSLIGQGVLQPDEVQQITGKLTNNVKETTNFLDNLLIWSRSQMNGIRIHFQDLDIFKLANETLEVFRFQCEEKNLSLQNQVPDGTHAFADREMIRMVLRNLVSNAIKFSIPGGIIHISASGKIEDDFIIVSVSDDGIGVKKEFQDKLFGVDNYTTVGTMDEKGSGIGLMLCRDFVERNGGKIWMESTQNKGSNFFFSLPQYHLAKREEGIKNLLADIL